MCGIVGYVGGRECSSLLFEGLKRLEYRGYDSSGIAVISGGEFNIRRAEGKLNELGNALRDSPMKGNPGIGHTRWATHGRPSEANAHPHRAGNVVVVHNGIIENYVELRQAIAATGRKFSSETDTEVLSHLIDIEISAGTSGISAVMTALSKVKGSYAMAVLSLKEPDRIFVAKNSSPLIIGIGEGENFIASDIPALIDATRRIVVLEDYEAAVLTSGGYQIFDLNTGDQIQREPITIDMTPAMAEKGGFRHFMAKEIHEQPRAIIDTCRGRISPERGEVIFDAEGPSAEVLAGVKRVHLAACGTSWHAALVGRNLLTSFARIPVEVHLASEFDPELVLAGPQDMFVSISQSGETLDTLRAQRTIKQTGVPTVAICNVMASSLAREAKYVIYTHAGPEISVASTKAFTTQIAALYLLALALGKVRGVLDDAQVQNHIGELLTVPGLMEEALREEVQIRLLAKKYMGYAHIMYLGRGLLYPVALEGALKMKELSYIHAEGYSAGEMKHGPIALIDETFPTLVMAPKGPWRARTAGNMEEVKARAGRVLAMVTTGDVELAERADDIMRIPDCPTHLIPLVATIPLQLLAYHVADLKGTDVDQPRNLAKSVTVE